MSPMRTTIGTVRDTPSPPADKLIAPIPAAAVASSGKGESAPGNEVIAVSGLAPVKDMPALGCGTSPSIAPETAMTTGFDINALARRVS